MTYQLKVRRRFRWSIVFVVLVAANIVLVAILFPEWWPRGATSPSAPAPTSGGFTVLQLPASGGGAASAIAAIGQPAPDFTLNTLDGGEVTLSGLKGQAVLINFWASWCPPCRLEMPDLVRAYEDHREEGFILLGVNLTATDSLPDIRDFVEEFKMTFPVLLDERYEVADLYGLRGLPLSVFINRDGVVVRIINGAMSGDHIEVFVEEILQ